MGYDKFKILKSQAVPLPIENIDTDQIIPARFLKATERKGFGENLFRDWRYDSNNNKKNFVLNNPKYKGKILIGGKNFGSGSSREHAAWAIYDYGFRCVISSFFADIFKNNSYKNGLLLIEIDKEKIDEIFTQITEKKTINIEVDVHNQFIYLEEKQFPFELDDFKKKFLLDGIDEVGFTLQHQNKIEDFEKNYKKTVPWLFK